MPGGVIEKLEMKVLLYAAGLSSDTIIEPKPDANSMNAFSYPELKETLGDASYLDSIILRKLEDDGCLSGEFRDRILLCPYCMAYNICFRDVCPECKSPNLRSVQMIHHFRCGHVGPETDFIKGERMICPKCFVPLMHVGKDYERPSEVFECAECTWSGSEAGTAGHCVFCDRHVAPHECKVQDVKAYRITIDGSISARSGAIVTRREKEDDELNGLETMGTDTRPFRSIKSIAVLAEEMGRMSDSFGVPLTAASLSPDVFSKAGASMTPEMSKSLGEAVAEKLNALLRPTDRLVSTSSGTMFLLMPHTKLEDARTIVSQILEEVSKLTFSGPLKRTTLSAGIAVWTKGKGVSKFFMEAKNARLEAASLGGNRIVEAP